MVCMVDGMYGEWYVWWMVCMVNGMYGEWYVWWMVCMLDGFSIVSIKLMM
jgi:hypothetical protein